MILSHMNETAKHVVDYVSVGTLIAALLSVLPAITTILVLLWAVARWRESVVNARVALLNERIAKARLRELGEEP